MTKTSLFAPLFIGVSLFGLAPAFAAAHLSSSQGSSNPAQSAEWIVDYGKNRCSLVRNVQGAEPVNMVLRTGFTSKWGELLLVSNAWRTDPLEGSDTADAVLLPANARHSVPARSFKLSNGGRLIALRHLEPVFFDEFSDAARIRIERKGKAVTEITLPNAEAAVDALEACNQDLLASWGIDLAERAALQRMPVPIGDLSSWISSSDYPDAAIRKNQSGPVVARFTVGTDGKVTECVTVVSSGSEPLDRRTCIALGRRKFEPAIGPEGKPVAVRLVESVGWLLAESYGDFTILTPAAPPPIGNRN